MPRLALSFTRNLHGRDFVVGDIHGHFGRLDAGMRKVDFNPAVDRMFSVGDLIDRGPESERVLEYVGQPWFHAVLGNHEQMAIRYADGSLDSTRFARNGGAWLACSPRAFRVDVADALSTLPVAITIETPAGDIGIVHADCPTTSWTDFIRRLDPAQSTDVEVENLVHPALWSRERYDSGDTTTVEDVAAIIVGHSPTEEMRHLGNVYFIDTGACFEHLNKLTLVELAPSADTILREAAIA